MTESCCFVHGEGHLLCANHNLCVVLIVVVTLTLVSEPALLSAPCAVSASWLFGGTFGFVVIPQGCGDKSFGIAVSKKRQVERERACLASSTSPEDVISSNTHSRCRIPGSKNEPRTGSRRSKPIQSTISVGPDSDGFVGRSSGARVVGIFGSVRNGNTFQNSKHHVSPADAGQTKSLTAFTTKLSAGERG